MTSNTRSTAAVEAPPLQPAVEPTVEARAAEARQIIREVVARLSAGEVADPLALLESLTSAADKAQAAATHATNRAQAASAAEKVEGLSLQRFLTAVCRRPYGDAGTLVTVGEVLADMPTLRTLLDDGMVGFGTVRKIVYLLHHKRREDRAVIDQAIADAAGAYRNWIPTSSSTLSPTRSTATATSWPSSVNSGRPTASSWHCSPAWTAPAAPSTPNTGL